MEKEIKNKKGRDVSESRTHELNFLRCPHCLMLLPGSIDEVKVCIWCHERTNEGHKEGSDG